MAATTTYFYKGITTDQTFGLTEYMPSTVVRALLVVGHGQGECNIGDLAGCKFSSGWGGWWWIKDQAEKLGIAVLFLNTSSTSKYSLKEYQYAVDWGQKRYAHLGITKDNTWVLGHSLGSYGAGRYAFIDAVAAFAKKVAGWIISASGPYNSGWTADKLATLMKIMADADLKVWGVTALNDTAMGTAPIYTTQVFDKMKALNPAAKVVMSIFPATQWDATTAHNMVLNRLTQVPIGIPAGITKGLKDPSLPLKMSVFQWMLANPRGSIWQEPTQPYVGALYAGDPVPVPVPVPTPTPTTPIYIKDVNYALKGGFFAIKWRDASPPQVVRPPVGDSIKNVFDRIVDENKPNERRVLTVTYTLKTLADTFDVKKIAAAKKRTAKVAKKKSTLKKSVRKNTPKKEAPKKSAAARKRHTSR